MLNDKVRWEPDHVPIAPADGVLAIEIPDNDIPIADCYIDDIFTTLLEHDMDRGSKMVPLVIHLPSQPVEECETICRKDLLSFLKFAHGRSESGRTIEDIGMDH
jgi:hypothetical protein